MCVWEQVALEGAASAELEAISRTAKHRLDRGIWTSTGGGNFLPILFANTAASKGFVHPLTNRTVTTSFRIASVHHPRSFLLYQNVQGVRHNGNNK